MMRCLVVAVLVIGCDPTKTMATSAKESFGKKYSCPLERVEVKERKDIDSANLLNPPRPESPPAEVKKDPGRLAKWQADQKEQDEKVAAGYRRSYTVFEAKGCDHDVLLACTNADNVGTAGTTVMCQEKPLP